MDDLLNTMIKAALIIIPILASQFAQAYTARKKEIKERELQKKQIDDYQTELLKKLAESDENQIKTNISVSNAIEEISKDIEIMKESQNQQTAVTIELYDMHKHKDAEKKLYNDIEDIVEYLTENTNRELQKILRSSVEKAIEVYKKLFDEDFEGVDKDRIYNKLKIRAFDILAKSDLETLNIIESKEKDFIEELKATYKPEFKNFCKNIETIAFEEINGERVKKFSILTKTFTESISAKTITIYTKYCIK